MSKHKSNPLHKKGKRVPIAEMHRAAGGHPNPKQAPMGPTQMPMTAEEMGETMPDQETGEGE